MPKPKKSNFVIQEAEIANALDFIEKYIPENTDVYYRNEAPKVLKDARSALLEILLSVDTRYSETEKEALLKAS